MRFAPALFLSTSRSVAISGLSAATLLAGIAATPAMAGHHEKSETAFKHDADSIGFEKAERRKYGNPIVADLDGDGLEDIIVTEHGSRAHIFWNEGGTFSKKSTTIIRGDTHGMGVADFDRDGRIDLVISQGGGNGGNPRTPVHFAVNKDRTLERIGTFDEFLATRGRAIKFLDVDQDGWLDMIYTGFAPGNAPKPLENNQLQRNNKGKFEFSSLLAKPNHPMSFNAMVTDLNDDGDPDVVLFGGRDIVYNQGGPGATFENRTEEVFGKVSTLGSFSSIAQLDFDRDGDIDLFITRAPGPFEDEIYYDEHTRRMGFFIFNDDFMYPDMQIEGDLVIDNLQETYATFGIHLGAERREVESERGDGHMGGRLVVKPEDAMGWPEGELRGLHIGYMGDGVWRVGGMVKSRLAGVINNVVTVPETKVRGELPAVLLENRDGRMVDVTAEMQIDIAKQTAYATPGDFNNDGWVDLVVLEHGSLATPPEHILLLNQQGKGFAKASAAGLISQEVGAAGYAATTVDYDLDGKLDLVFGNERGRWYLNRNVGTDADGNWLTVVVNNSPEGLVSPLGARISVTACGMTQNRTVGDNTGGESDMIAARVHFGLGDCEKADLVKVRWSTSERFDFKNVPANSAVSTVAP